MTTVVAHPPQSLIAAQFAHPPPSFYGDELGEVLESTDIVEDPFPSSVLNDDPFVLPIPTPLPPIPASAPLAPEASALFILNEKQKARVTPKPKATAKPKASAAVSTPASSKRKRSAKAKPKAVPAPAPAPAADDPESAVDLESDDLDELVAEGLKKAKKPTPKALLIQETIAKVAALPKERQRMAGKRQNEAPPAAAAVAAAVAMAQQKRPALSVEAIPGPITAKQLAILRAYQRYAPAPIEDISTLPIMQNPIAPSQCWENRDTAIQLMQILVYLSRHPLPEETEQDTFQSLAKL